MHKCVRVYIGVFFFAIALVWRLFVSPILILEPAVNYSVNLEHDEDNRFDIGGSWSGNTISLAKLEYVITKADPSTVHVNTTFSATSISGNPLFDLKQEFVYDRFTQKNLPGGTDKKGGTYYTFPPHTQKKEYLWWPATFGEPVNLSFLEELSLQGTLVYHYRGQEEDLDDTGGYEFLPLVPETYRVFSRAIIDVFVEPISGYILGYNDQGTSYYVDDKKNHIWDIASWGNRFKEENHPERIEQAKKKIQTIFIAETVIPILLILAGFSLIASKFLPKQK